MILLPISPSGAVSSGMVAEVSHAVTSGSNTYLEFDGESNEPKVIPEGTSGTSGLVVEAVNIGRWGAEQNARFKKLAHDEALRELSIVSRLCCPVGRLVSSVGGNSDRR